MKRYPTLLALALASAVAFAAQAGPARVTDPAAPRSLPAQGNVEVSWNDPSTFTDIRYSHNRWEAERGDWVRQLAQHFRNSAEKNLAAGERLAVTITDIKRAGEYEPWRGPNADDIRIVRDLYPPRLSFSYTLYGADGRVVDQGERKLVDMAFLMGSQPLNTDPLRYEKRMIDQWTRRELGSGRELSSR